MTKERITIITGGEFGDGLLKQLAKDCGGYTLTDHRGGWIDDDGDLIEEKGQTLVVFTPGGNLSPRVTMMAKNDATYRGEDVIIIDAETSNWRLV